MTVHPEDSHIGVPRRSDGQSWEQATGKPFKPKLALELVLDHGSLTRYLKSDPHATPASMYSIPENQPIMDAVANLVGAYALDETNLLQAPEGYPNAKRAKFLLIKAVVEAQKGLYKASTVDGDPFNAAGLCDSFGDHVQGYVEQGLKAVKKQAIGG